MKDDEAIGRFLTDICCLDELESMLGKSNIFDVLGMARAEIRHSYVLRWLLDPKGSHGLGELFLRSFLQRLAGLGGNAIALLSVNFESFVVLREYKHIDLLLLSKEARVVVAIENKVDSSEHSRQLQRYAETLERDFPGYHKERVYLSPEGRSPSDEAWLPMGYVVVLEALRYCLQRVNLSEESKLLLTQYASLLEREFMDKEKLSEICNRIYREHKQALDLIFELREDQCRTVFEMIDGWFKRHPASPLKYDAEHSCKTYIRFTTETLVRLVPPLANGKKSAWGTEMSVYYEVVNRENGLSAKLSASSKNMEPQSREALRVAFNHDVKAFEKDWKWKLIHSFPTRLRVNVQEDESLDQEQVDAFMERLEKDVQAVEAGIVF